MYKRQLIGGTAYLYLSFTEDRFKGKDEITHLPIGHTMYLYRLVTRKGVSAEVVYGGCRFTTERRSPLLTVLRVMKEVSDRLRFLTVSLHDEQTMKLFGTGMLTDAETLKRYRDWLGELELLDLVEDIQELNKKTKLEIRRNTSSSPKRLFTQLTGAQGRQYVSNISKDDFYQGKCRFADEYLLQKNGPTKSESLHQTSLF